MVYMLILAIVISSCAPAQDKTVCLEPKVKYVEDKSKLEACERRLKEKEEECNPYTGNTKACDQWVIDKWYHYCSYDPEY